MYWYFALKLTLARYEILFETCGVCWPFTAMARAMSRVRMPCSLNALVQTRARHVSNVSAWPLILDSRWKMPSAISSAKYVSWFSLHHGGRTKFERGADIAASTQTPQWSRAGRFQSFLLCIFFLSQKLDLLQDMYGGRGRCEIFHAEGPPQLCLKHLMFGSPPRRKEDVAWAAPTIRLTRRQTFWRYPPDLLKVSNKTESSKQSSNMAIQHPTTTKIKRVPYIQCLRAIPSCHKTWWRYRTKQYTVPT